MPVARKSPQYGDPSKIPEPLSSKGIILEEMPLLAAETLLELLLLLN